MSFKTALPDKPSHHKGLTNRIVQNGYYLFTADNEHTITIFGLEEVSMSVPWREALTSLGYCSVEIELYGLFHKMKD